MFKIDLSLLDSVIVGRVNPVIYAFTTETVPNYLKVGDTYRPLEIRLKEWKKHFPNLEKQFENIANVDAETFFRDYAVHKFLEYEKGKERLERNTLKDIPYYSNEFFKEAKQEDVKDALIDIEKSYKNNEGKYQFYKYDESRVPVTYTYKRDKSFVPRPNQQATIDRFKEAVEKGRQNLLMYAVMRFGKSFTSMCCATEIDAKFVIIVSAKADVKEEWKKTVESHTKFEGYDFINSETLLRETSVISEKLQAREKVVLFLTLQDLQGKAIKEKHKEVFENQIDLLIIDETHFGARANEYGRVLRDNKLSKKEQKSELKQNDNSLDDLEDAVKVLDTKVRLHLSGTPYRILMKSEFTPDDIIAFYQFSDIADDKENWDNENLNVDEVNEWDNPYFGFPQMVRFAFNPNESSSKKMEELKKLGYTYAFSRLFRPKSIVKDTANGNHRKFENEQEILDLLKIIDGTQDDDNILSFLDYEKIKEGNMCQHIVCVLPFRASCDALEVLLQKHHFKNLSDYKIINIAGVENEKQYKKTQMVKSAIKDCEAKNLKTITLTVNRMLTGSTVEQWDTMLYFKDTASPQEYDQAIFRLQNQYIKEYKAPDGDVIKYNMKPQTLLVDFNPNRMFQMQETKSKIYNVNTEENGNSRLENRIKRELEISPIIALNNNKITQVEATDILNAIREYSSNKSVLDEATTISIDLSLLDIPSIRAEIEKQAKIGSKQGLEIKASEGEGDDIDADAPDDAEPTKEKEHQPKEAITEKEENEFKGKFAMYYARILFFAFLTDNKIKSLEDLISVSDENTDNKRIIKNLALDKNVLNLFQKHINPFILSELDYKIYNINTLANDKSIDPVERASSAMRKFSRLSESEVMTPEWLTDKIVEMLPEDAINKSSKFVDIASKKGEFAYAVYKKYGKEIANNFYSIPTSKVAYEFTRKVYKLLELNMVNIENTYNAYDLVEQDDLIVDEFLRFNEQKLKFDVILGNPPYQESDGGFGRSSKSIYPLFVERTKSMGSRFLSLIIPARWYAGGKSLDNFRKEMLNDKSIRKLMDFKNSADVFNGVDIAGGICCFLRDNKYEGDCEIISKKDGEDISVFRSLDEYDILIRSSEAVPILRKILAVNENGGKNLSETISSRKPFRLPTNYVPSKVGIPCHFIQKIGLSFAKKEDVQDSNNVLDKWKLLIPFAPIAGQTDFSKPVGFYYDGNVRIAKPGECCTESWLVACAFDTEKEVLSFKSYLFTKIVRFLLLQTVVSQHVTRSKFVFVPDIGKYQDEWSDEILIKRWGITNEEWNFIDSKIRNIKRK